ncbi:MAG: nucleotidyltransferase substrate binding protein [Deferrisomatales bacterium]|nr:nucleotidyltransferase substrate binding protein [Deferrisomatales bacterium]
MSDTDIRWRQRLNNYRKALAQLELAVDLSRQRPLTNLETQGIIQGFEFTHELAWNLMRDYFLFQGTGSIMGSRDATREAFEKGMVTDGETWMEMIRSRNQTLHTYNQAVAEEICEKVISRYFPLFKALERRMGELD